MEQTMLFQTTFLIAYTSLTGKVWCVCRMRSGGGRSNRSRYMLWCSHFLMAATSGVPLMCSGSESRFHTVNPILLGDSRCCTEFLEILWVKEVMVFRKELGGVNLKELFESTDHRLVFLPCEAIHREVHHRVTVLPLSMSDAEKSFHEARCPVNGS